MKKNKKILIIHPEDNTTFFLNRIKNDLLLSNNSIIHHYNVKPNNTSKTQCIEIINEFTEGGLIIFLGHGKSDSLYGSKGKLYENKEQVSNDAIEENPSLYYYDESFIHKGNISVFKNKNVFCLACNSNGIIGKYAIEANTNTFLGFGDIPTSISEFNTKYKNVSHDLVKSMKTEINYIIKKSLSIGIANQFSFYELSNYINFITNQRITDILINQKWNNERYRLADNLYLFKKETKIYGNKHNKLFY